MPAGSSQEGTPEKDPSTAHHAETIKEINDIKRSLASSFKDQVCVFQDELLQLKTIISLTKEQITPNEVTDSSVAKDIEQFTKKADEIQELFTILKTQIINLEKKINAQEKYLEGLFTDEQIGFLDDPYGISRKLLVEPKGTAEDVLRKQWEQLNEQKKILLKELQGLTDKIQVFIKSNSEDDASKKADDESKKENLNFQLQESDKFKVMIEERSKLIELLSSSIEGISKLLDISNGSTAALPFDKVIELKTVLTALGEPTLGNYKEINKNVQETIKWIEDYNPLNHPIFSTTL